MVTEKTLTAFCAWLRENANPQSIPAIVRFEEEVCDSLEYSALKKAADTQVVQQKYSKGTYLTGVCGYYYPSDIRIAVTDNVKRGRLVRENKLDASDYIYEYDGDGHLLRILCPNMNVATYRIALGPVVLFIGYHGYLVTEQPTPEHILIASYDDESHLQAMIQDYWYVDRYTGEKLGHTIDLEIYHKISAQEWLCTMTEYFSDPNRAEDETAYYTYLIGKYVFSYEGNKIARWYRVKE